MITSTTPRKAVHRARLAPGPETLLALLLAGLGLTVISGWLLHLPGLTEFIPGSVPMVFNTALCFLLAGSGIVLMQLEHAPRARQLRQALAVLMLALSSLTLVEFFSGVNLGIDLAGLHTWYDYGNTQPGRMAPNTALGFMLAGATMLLHERVAGKLAALGVVILTFGVLAVGLTGLVGYLLAPDLLFGWARSARMALHTASGMIVCAIALWLTWSGSAWYQVRGHFREHEKIRILGAAILMIVAVTVGLLGFVLLQTSLEKTLESSLEASLRHRLPWFRATMVNAVRHSDSMARMSGLDAAGRALLATPTDPAARSRVQAIAERLVIEGFRGVAVANARGELLLASGKLPLVPALAAPLDPQAESTLAWDGELLLRTRRELALPGGAHGHLVMDLATPALTRSLFSASGLGDTGEITACTAQRGAVMCFPGSRHDAPFKIERPGKAPLPVEAAMAGNSGVVLAQDYRGHNVVAAYRPLAPGLGFVAKQDTTEVYAVVRNALLTGVPIIVAIAVLGAGLLFAQLHPLAKGLWASRQAAADRETEMRAIMDAAGDGILTVSPRGLIQSANPAVTRIFGYAPGELVGKNFTVLMPLEVRRAQLRTMAQFVQGRLAQLIAKTSVELDGLQKGGASFPLELTVTEASLAGQRVFVGVMRNITERKRAERKLYNLAQFDALTGLPNRSLFEDRLATAISRTRRSQGAVALMFLDLDGFKQVNDTLGHHAGDALLVQFAERLGTVVRRADTVARLAGDEFTVILEDLARPREDAQAVANKIVTSMQQAFVVSGQQVHVTVSIGLALHEASAGEASVASLLQRADQAMYLAKRAGKNAFSVA